MSPDYYIRPAELGDLKLLEDLLSNNNCLQHRHLDWRQPADWLGRQPFWILGKKDIAVAAISFPDEPAGVYWVRLFAALNTLRLSQTWKLLFEKAASSLPPAAHPLIASLAVHKWFLDVLNENGFSRLHDIVVLEWKAAPFPRIPGNPGLLIREMNYDDLPSVQTVDDLAFEGIWKNSLPITTRAYHTAAYATVAEVEGRIIGYQISTANSFSAHLARIAILPELHRHGIGQELIRNLLQKFTENGINSITVNTQSDNFASLALYKKTGFEFNNEKFPVLTYKFPLPGQG